MQMVGVTLINTTVEAIEQSIEKQRLILPDMLETTWRKSSGPMEGRFVIMNTRQQKWTFFYHQLETIN